MNKNVLLMILDGWGIAKDPKVSAIDNANTPFIDSLYKKYPHAQLRTDGTYVGLPDGQMGNSEVGHMNLGAGRIVYQDLVKINKSIDDNSLKDQKALQEAFAYAKEKNKKIHFLGLLSDGGVHSHINHLLALLDVAKDYGLEDLFVHAFTDGRDTDPQGGINYLRTLNKHIAQSPAQVATLTGRYFAMDRDHRWERVKKAYDVLVKGLGQPTHDVEQALLDSYATGITDEFIEPMVLLNGVEPVALIEPDDVVIFFNYRTDRGRQLTAALSQVDFPDVGMKKLPLYFVTMTTYDHSYKQVHVIFKKDDLTNTLGETLAKAGKTQVRIAETEKYPHVTFFFNGGRELAFENETRLLCNSPKVATYDLQPEMSAGCITDKIIEEINKNQPNFICLNFANPDMVGHTGSLEAAISACEAVDKQTELVITQALKNKYTSIIIADHGNCEVMINPDGSVNTAHTTNPVPIIIVDPEIKKVNNGILGDIAPTVLKLIGVKQPQEMTQSSLI